MSSGRLAAGILVVLAQAGDPAFPPGVLPASSLTRSQAPPVQRADLREAVATARSSTVRTLAAAERRDVEASYDLNGGAPVWADAAGRLAAHARAGLALVQQAASEGLSPADYHAPDLAALAATLDASNPATTSDVARFDVLMTVAVVRYYRHVHFGRVDPRALGLQLDPSEEHDMAVLLRAAVDRGRLADTVEQLAPPLSQYRALKQMLGRYRALAADAAAPPAFRRTLRPGDPFDDGPALWRLLVAVGDLPPGAAAPPPGLYGAELSAGVARFQRRHGLDADGVVGAATAAALGVPLDWRVRQIELALERLRWLPDFGGERLIAVNIPMFRLWAWSRVPSDDPPELTMSVIVGRALDTRTPVFAERMRHVVFRPYWNVPASIIRNELLPAIRRDPGYLARENLEIVDGPGDNATPVAPGAETLSRLESGALRVRQRPGPRNALGLVKFMLPNRNDVYLHDTPAPQLFGRSRRDFSHGCIRVEDPAALAAWALGRDPAWTSDRVRAAMHGAPNFRVDLAEPIRVVIFYTTAVVVPEEGAAHFAIDLYGHDVRLDRALSREGGQVVN